MSLLFLFLLNKPYPQPPRNSLMTVPEYFRRKRQGFLVLSLQQRPEVGTGDGGGVGGYLLGSALGDYETAATAAFGTEVE